MIDWDDKKSCQSLPRLSCLGSIVLAGIISQSEPSPEGNIYHAQIDEIYTKHPYFGSRLITVGLNNNGINIKSQRAVQRHMREMGIAGISSGP